MDRSAIMARVKSRDTTPELAVRRLLRALGHVGYRLDRRDIPGRPDIAFVGRRRAIFVHGCYRHGHNCKRGARVPKTDTEYWQAKIARNRARDQQTLVKLTAQNWRVLTIWECELKNPEEVSAALLEFMANDS